MTNDDLANLLEGRPCRAKIRLAVALPGLPPMQTALVGAVTSKTVAMPIGPRRCGCCPARCLGWCRRGGGCPVTGCVRDRSRRFR